MGGRKLLYVPIIHVEADLGSLAEAIARTSRHIYGPDRWDRHQETVRAFWDSIAAHFDRLDAAGLKVYQDGLPAEGELAERIIAEGARGGSRNFQIVQRLMERGAEVRRTEDPALLRREYECLRGLVRAGSALARLRAYLRYKARKGGLLAARDRFIAARIDETLKPGETGVLFLGAHHDVLSRLPPDIEVDELKERDRMMAYVGLLRRARDEGALRRAAEYLAAPAGRGR